MNREPAHKPRFNFTLRESLIAMAAIAALIALAVKSYENAQPFVSTGFFNSLDIPKAKTIVTAIGRDLDIKTDQLGAGAGESSGGDTRWPACPRMKHDVTWNLARQATCRDCDHLIRRARLGVSSSYSRS